MATNSNILDLVDVHTDYGNIHALKGIVVGWPQLIRQPAACNKTCFFVPVLLAATDNARQPSGRLTAKHPLPIVP